MFMLYIYHTKSRTQHYTPLEDYTDCKLLHSIHNKYRYILKICQWGIPKIMTKIKYPVSLWKILTLNSGNYTMHHFLKNNNLYSIPVIISNKPNQ